MRISERDAQIIADIAFYADEPVTSLARRAKTQVHKLRYVIERFKNQEVLKKRWVIDLISCGWQRYEIFFSGFQLSPEIRQKLINFLIKSEQTTYLAEVGGDFDFELIILVRDASAAKEFLSELTEKFGNISFYKEVALHQKVHYFPRKYLSKKPKLGVYSLLGAKEFQKLDSLDHEILKRLSSDPDCSQRELAKLCACTAVTIQSRLEKLYANSVLKGAMYSFQGKLFGTQNYIFLLYSKGFGAKFGEQLYNFCYTHPICTNMKECFGSWDFEVGVEVRDYQQLLEFKELLVATFPSDIQNLKLLSRFTTHKFNFYPFLNQKTY